MAAPTDRLDPVPVVIEKSRHSDPVGPGQPLSALPRMGSWTWNPRTKDVHWSEELYQILGFEPGRDIATLEAFDATIHPEDREFLASERHRQVSEGRSRSVECRIVRRDGGIRDVLLDGSHLTDEKGAVYKIFGTVVDITDMRRAEREAVRNLNLLNESQRIAQVGSWLWDPALDTCQWTDSLYTMLGLSRQEGGDERAFLKLVLEDDRKAAASLRREALMHGSSEPVELRIRRPDGALRHVQMQYRRLVGEPERRPAFLCTLCDVSSRHALEESLRQSRKMEAIGRLAGGVAHDFNNLLTVILGCVESLQEKGDDARLKQIAHAAEMGGALTRQLLAFSRQSVTQPQALDLNEVVSSMSGVLERLVGDSVDISLRLGADLPALFADRHHIEQILLNLAVNARDAMPRGGSVVLKTFAAVAGQDKPHDEACEVGFSLEDTGVGMSEEVQGRIFEPFFTTKQPGKGTGLGLATVFGIVTQAGGRIEVDSKPGRGSIFKLYFPAHARSVSVSPAAPIAIPEEKGDGEMVLVVEDNEKLREVIYEFLDGAGYRVQAFGRPNEALAWFKEHGQEVEALITDVLMPEKNGRHLAAEMLALQPGLRTLFISGYSGEFAETRDFPGGFLQKPFRKKELLDALQAVLQGASAG